jgi:hypothetical protein
MRADRRRPGHPAIGAARTVAGKTMLVSEAGFDYRYSQLFKK